MRQSPTRWNHVPLVALVALGAPSLACDGVLSPWPGQAAPDGRVLAIPDGGLPLPTTDGSGPATELGPRPAPDLGPGPAPDFGPGPKPDAKPPLPPDTGPGPDIGYDWTKHITFHTIAATGGSCNAGTYGAYYCDVMTHTQGPYLGADTLTNVHESQHFMAHENDGSTAAADKFIYFANGKGAFFPEPQLKTKGIWDAIQIKGSCYNTYIASRPDQALGENIVDEWRAYITEEIVAIQMAAIQGKTSGVSGLVLGGVEFLYYNAAALHALQTKEPAFLQANPQAVAVFAMLAEEAKKWTIDKGLTPGLFSFPSSANGILAELRTGPNSAPIRNTLKGLYGAKWTSSVLGF